MEKKDVVPAPVKPEAPPLPLPDGGRQACAACKHQRKKCSPNCILSPFFPSNKNDEFQAVHKIYGVSNISKLLKNINTFKERQEAIVSLVWEARWRQKDPVYGCFGLIRKIVEENKFLKYQLQQIMATQAGTMNNKNSMLVGLNGNNGISGGTGFEYNSDYLLNNGNCTEGSGQFGYGSLVQTGKQEKRYQDRDGNVGIGGVSASLAEQHEPYYYHTGQPNGVNEKSEEAAWLNEE